VNFNLSQISNVHDYFFLGGGFPRSPCGVRWQDSVNLCSAYKNLSAQHPLRAETLSSEKFSVNGSKLTCNFSPDCFHRTHRSLSNVFPILDISCLIPEIFAIKFLSGM